MHILETRRPNASTGTTSKFDFTSLGGSLCESAFGKSCTSLEVDVPNGPTFSASIARKPSDVSPDGRCHPRRPYSSGSEVDLLVVQEEAVAANFASKIV